MSLRINALYNSKTTLNKTLYFPPLKYKNLFDILTVLAQIVQLNQKGGIFLVHLDYRDARPIYTQIIDGIREQVITGVLQPGDKLPSVRELATSLAINPNTIQRSYRRLEAEGWIATVPGKGCFVCDNDLLQEKEKAKLLLTFDETTTALLALGATRDELIVRLRKGGQ